MPLTDGVAVIQLQDKLTDALCDLKERGDSDSLLYDAVHNLHSALGLDVAGAVLVARALDLK